MCDLMSILNIVSLAHKECGEGCGEPWDGAEKLPGVSHCLFLRDVLKPLRAWSGFWRQRSVCGLRTLK